MVCSEIKGGQIVAGHRLIGSKIKRIRKVEVLRSVQFPSEDAITLLWCRTILLVLLVL
jgi:hypothetical protein